MVLTYLPIVYQNLPKFIRSYYLWSAILVSSILFIRPKVFLDKTLRYVLFYFIAFYLLLYFNFWSLNDSSISIDSPIVVEIFAFVIAFSLNAYFNSTRDYGSLVFIVKWTLFFIGVTAMLSIVSSFIDPSYARKMAGEGSLDSELITRLGGGAYGFASALVCLFPIMIYYYRNNSQCIYSKKLILFFGLLCFFALLRMQIVANILVSFIAIIFSLAGSKSFKKSIGLLAVTSIILIVIPKQFYADSLVQISTYFNKGSEVNNKLNDISRYVSMGNAEVTGVSSRADRYPLLWNAFKNNILFGHFAIKNSYNIDEGGHLYFMYKLAGLGILNFVFFIYIFVKFIKINLSKVDNQYSFYLLLSFFSIIALGLIKSLVTRDLWYAYFFILPGLYLLKKVKPKINDKVNSA